MSELSGDCIDARRAHVSQFVALLRALNDDLARRANCLDVYRTSVLEKRVPIIDIRAFGCIVDGIDETRGQIDRIVSLANHFVEAENLKPSLEESLERLLALYRLVDATSNSILFNVIS